MLVLSRKCGESLIIGGKIEIKVTEIVGDKVKIGIAAPKEMLVLRKELLQTMESNREAAVSAPSKELLAFLASLEETPGGKNG